MFFNQTMSLTLSFAGAIATTVTFLDKSETLKVRSVRSVAILWFTLMELPQYTYLHWIYANV